MNFDELIVLGDPLTRELGTLGGRELSENFLRAQP